MTNFEYLKSLDLEEYAENRIDYDPGSKAYCGDFYGYCEYKSEAIHKEIEWLQSERQ